MFWSLVPVSILFGLCSQAYAGRKLKLTRDTLVFSMFPTLKLSLLMQGSDFSFPNICRHMAQGFYPVLWKIAGPPSDFR